MKKAIGRGIVAVVAMSIAGCGAILGGQSTPVTSGADAGDGAPPTTRDAGLDAQGPLDGPEAEDAAPDAPDDADAAPLPGTLDPSFGTNGVVRVQLNITAPSEIDRIALQSDGRILYSGYGYCQGGHFAFIGRLLPDGGVDTSFNPEGTTGYTAGCTSVPNTGMLWLTTPGPNGPGSPNDFNVWVSELASGDIGVAGTVLYLNNSDEVTGAFMFASQFTSSAKFETTFGDAGYDYLPSAALSVPALATDFLVLDSGTYFVAGAQAGAPAIANVLPGSGTLNTSFGPAPSEDGGTGLATYPYGTTFNSIAALPRPTSIDLVASVGGAGATLGIAIDTATGQVDHSLGGGVFAADAAAFTSANAETFGWVITNSTEAEPLDTSTVAVLKDSSFAFVGTNRSDGTVAIVHFKGDGSLDTDYGTGNTGVAAVAFKANVSSAVGTPDGKLVVSGLPPSPGSPLVFRVASDGTLDQSFGAGTGRAQPFASGATPEGGRIPLAVDSSGRILVGGLVNGTTSPDAGCCNGPTVEIARFLP